MRPCARVSRLMALAALAGCSSATEVLVTIDAAPGVTVSSSLTVDATVDGRTRSATAPAPVTLPGTLLVALPDESTEVVVTARALDGAGATLSASGTVQSVAGAQVTLTLTLGRAAPPDGGGGGDLAPDAATPPDAGGGGDLAMDTCADGVKDGNEEGADCGGPCAALCPGKPCLNPGDCASGICAGVCQAASGPPSWLAGPTLPAPRNGGPLVLGANGALYLVGGSSTGDANGALASVLELDPGAGAWSAAPDMSTERYHHAATLDGQGAIWAMAGNGLSSYLASTEALFAGVWSLRASLPSAHAAIAATTLLDGRILLVDNSTCDLYDPMTGAWTDLPLLRDTTGVTVVHDGRAFAIGGEVNSTPVSEVDSFDPMTTAWTVRAPMSTARRAPGAVYAPDGRIYAIGGTDGTFAIATVEAYFPASDLWSAAVASLAVARSDAGVAVGADGRIYVVGGYDEAAPLASVEVYGPTLSLSASQAARGGAPVSASGANFAASARVGLRLDDVPLAVTTTDAGGAFQVAFVVPANGPAPGSHQLVAEDVRAQYPVTTAFTVTP